MSSGSRSRPSALSPNSFAQWQAVGTVTSFSERLARLRHSWLENQLVSKSTDDMVHLWRAGRWTALDREFGGRVDEVMDAVGCLEEGVSPAQLVDRLEPFRQLPEETRRALAAAVHRAFLAVYPAALVAAELATAAGRLRSAIEELRRRWDAERTADAEASITIAWKETHARASELLAVLRAVPKGVVLP